MRARLMMKLMGVIVMLGLTVFTARSCTSSAPGSALNPSTVEQNGLATLCAQQEANAQASGDTSPQTLVIPAGVGNLPSSAGGLGGLAPGSSYACPTTTLPTGLTNGG